MYKLSILSNSSHFYSQMKLGINRYGLLHPNPTILHYLFKMFIIELLCILL